MGKTTIFVGIDGTGPWSDTTYNREMQSSFVRRLSRECGHARSLYLRGPSVTGYEDHSIRNHAVTQVLQWATPDTQLVMAGYSRGGAIAIRVARQLLQRRPALTVRCLLLFDAVERDASVESTIIPANVRRAFHAMRDASTGSRTTFGHCGTQVDNGATQLQKRSFLGTHGAMGGVPWKGESEGVSLFGDRPTGKTRVQGPVLPGRGAVPLPVVPVVSEAGDRIASAAVGSYMWSSGLSSGFFAWLPVQDASAAGRWA